MPEFRNRQYIDNVVHEVKYGVNSIQHDNCNDLAQDSFKFRVKV